LNAAGIDLTWILTVLAIIVGGAAIPMAMILMWPPISTIAVIVSPWVGLVFSLITWLVVSKLRSGSISVATTGMALNALAGNIVSVLTGPIAAIILTWVFPWKYQATDPLAIARNEKILGRAPPAGDSTPPPPQVLETQGSSEKTAGTVDKGVTNQKEPEEQDQTPVANGVIEYLTTNHIEPMDPEAIRSSTRLAVWFTIAFVLIAMILVPFSLFGSSWTFSRAGFKGWCVVSFLWVWCSMILCVFWPLIESRATIARIAKGLIREGMGGSRSWKREAEPTV
jgi:hypothetical protein